MHDVIHHITANSCIMQACYTPTGWTLARRIRSVKITLWILNWLLPHCHHPGKASDIMDNDWHIARTACFWLLLERILFKRGQICKIVLTQRQCNYGFMLWLSHNWFSGISDYTYTVAHFGDLYWKLVGDSLNEES